jgi:hypothetical protein
MAASYPTAVKSFTVKSAGDTIQPTHINDLQDEVAAIEDGILNGTAPLTSSNAVVANLSVAGGSTLATLQVTGNSTIAGTLTVTKIVSTSLQASGLTSKLWAYSVNPVQIAASMTALALETELEDLLGEYDSTTYTFTPQSSGTYQVHAQLYTGGNSAFIAIGLYVNSSLVMESLHSGGAGNNVTAVQINALVRVSSGAAGAMQVKGMYNGSTNRGDSGVARSYLQITKIF